MKLGTLAALASLCRQDAADIGITLRSLARFFKRSRKGERDLPEIERFIEWAVQRGECVKGVPTAWKASVTLAGAGKPVEVSMYSLTYDGAPAAYQMRVKCDTASESITFSNMDFFAESVPVNAY